MTAANAKSQVIRQALQEAALIVGRLEALVLLGHVLGKAREFLIAHDDEVIEPEALLEFRSLVDLRHSGIPLPYLTGRQEFYGRWFHVTDSVLIPRPDTEVLIEQALIVAADAPKILDLGTGSGCIAVTLALEIPQADVLATDAVPDAVTVAEENAKSLGARVAFRQGFWWNAVEDGERFDLIVSNPPYIHPDDEHLRNLTHEPLGALTDGIDGLEAIREIVSGAMGHLRHGGWLLLEHGWDQGSDVSRMLKDAGFAAVRTVKDYGGNDRVTMGRKAD